MTCQLYHDAALQYPPQWDDGVDDQASALSACRPQSVALSADVMFTEIDHSITESGPTLQNEMMVDCDVEDENDEETIIEEVVADPKASVEAHKSLFARTAIFISRECPRTSLEFVIKACGGQVGWSQSSGAASPFAETDAVITHQICDRDSTHISIIPGRQYIQPQWVYDSINAARLLDTAKYALGVPLPPHLSPFMKYTSAVYNPEDPTRALADGGDADKNDGDDDDDDDESIDFSIATVRIIYES